MSSFVSFKEFQRRYDSSLDESRKSYSRLLNHMQKDPIIIFMSVDKNPLWLGTRIAEKQHKEGLSDDELRKLGKYANSMKREGFKTQLRNRDFGYVEIDGGYKEKDKKTGDEIPVDENSFIIYTNEENKDKILKFCIEKGKETLQDSIMIVKKNIAHYYYLNDGRLEYVGKFSFQKLDDYWSRLHKNSNHDRYLSFRKDVEKASKQVERYVNMLNDE